MLPLCSNNLQPLFRLCADFVQFRWAPFFARRRQDPANPGTHGQWHPRGQMMIRELGKIGAMD